MVTDRRAGKRNVPHVGKQPRSRTTVGTWRKRFERMRPLRLDEISYFLNPLMTDAYYGLTIFIGPVL